MNENKIHGPGKLVLQRYLLPLIFVLNTTSIGILFFSITIAAESTMDESCCGCHTEVCARNIIMDYVHLPFLEQKCSVCHVYTEPETATEDISETGKPVIINVPDHPIMRDRAEISISICTICHPGFTGRGNHPVKIHPSIKVKIPDDYPTDSDGKISCITCHANHASNFEFRTIKPCDRALCVGCHKGYPSPTEIPPISLIKNNF